MTLPASFIDINAVILGSGACVPSLSRSACSLLVRTGGLNMVFDIGPGTMHRMLGAGLAVFDVTNLFISHFHPDHTGELAAFLFANKYPDGSLRTRPLTLAGGPGFRRFFDALKRAYGDWITLFPGMLEILELAAPDERRTFGNVTVDTAPTAHREESRAFRVTGTGGGSIVYSGDTEYSGDLVELATGADVLVLECAMPEGRDVPGHLTPSAAGRIANEAGVKELVLTHFYPETLATDVRADCRRTYRGPLRLAEDLMRIRIPARRRS